jgi:Fe-Mn family superoxide dismutase
MSFKKYELPKLAFGFGDLAPFLSEEQLKIHYEKHHQAYAVGVNTILDKISEARKNEADYDTKSVLKNLAFNLGGYDLHTLFWENLIPISKATAKPTGELLKNIETSFGSFERFKKEFTQTAMSVEGSGWACMVKLANGELLLMQIEKHNVNLYPNHKILLVLDMFEHAFYLDYKNDKGEYVEAFWSVVNWEKVGKRF